MLSLQSGRALKHLSECKGLVQFVNIYFFPNEHFLNVWLTRFWVACLFSRSEVMVKTDTFFVLDIDECSKQANGGCHHGCLNTPGSFRCSCRSGFRLEPNGKRCMGKHPLHHLLPCPLLNEPEYNLRRNSQKYYLFNNTRACSTKRADNFFKFRYFN